MDHLTTKTKTIYSYKNKYFKLLRQTFIGEYCTQYIHSSKFSQLKILMIQFRIVRNQWVDHEIHMRIVSQQFGAVLYNNKHLYSRVSVSLIIQVAKFS